ncbi:MAG: NAD-dependent epimerase/dehydratase family protein [Anaerolineales bacterium]
MKYLVTGATGFVGAHVVKQLLVGGHAVNAVVRSPGKAAALADFGVKLFPGDVADKASLLAPMEGVDGVFHIAGWYKVGARDKSQARATNVDGTRNVLETMRELNIAKGVYTSTLAVFSDTHGQKPDETFRFTGKHISVYDQTKAEAHDIAEGFIRNGLPLVIVQPGLIYGPGDTSALAPSIQQYLRRRLPVVPRGTTFCWAHVDDIARGHLLAMEKGKIGESYIIAGPCHKLTEFFDLAEEITGVPAPKTRPAPGLMRAMAGLMSVIEKVAPVPETYSSEYLRVNGGTTYMGDNAKARRELGYSPRSLREGMTETLKYEMERLKEKEE